MTPTRLEVDQILFGYQRGHRLLAASRPIPPAVEDRLLPLTDASFWSELKSLSGGEPIEELSSYLLYRSWPALEVSRPGAVWTHGLLIPFADLGRVADLGLLLKSLRPPGANGIEDYEQPVKLRLAASGTRRTPRSERLAAGLLVALYGSPSEQVRWPEEDPDRVLGDLMGIWSQQWPRLRRSFRFKSVAEAAPRFLSGIDLVISADPDRATNRVGADPDLDDRWVDSALSDLASGGGPLREFLWRYGAEADGGRAAFLPLVRLHLAARGRETPGSLRVLRDLLASEFPSPSQMSALKRSLFGPIEEPASELQRLQVLLSSGGKGFSSDDIEIRSRTKELWKRNREGAFALFQASSDSPGKGARREFVSASIPLLRAPEIARLAAERPPLFRKIVQERGDFLTKQAFWKALPPDGEGTTVAVLRSHVTGGEERRQILAVLVGLDREQTIAALYPGWDEVAIAGLNLLSRRSRLERAVLSRWIPILTATEDDVVDWVGPSESDQPALLAALASFMDPIRAARATSPELWIPISRLDTSEIADVDPTEVKAFLLAVGLSSHGGAARELTSASLAEVDHAIASKHLSHRSWLGLERSLPPGKKDWDHKERLRRAFVDTVIAEGWPKEAVVRAIGENRPLGERVAALLEKRNKKKGLARKLWDTLTP